MNIIRFLLFFCFIPLSATPYILVSVAPYKYFVEEIGGDTVEVGLLVPAGASSHTFEPTPKQMLAAAKGNLWFGINEPFEAKVLPVLKQHNNGIEWIDLRTGVDLIRESACSHGSCIDPHFWLSPKVSIVQAKIIADTLSAKYPEHRELYQKNFQKLSNRLTTLDDSIAKRLAPLKNRSFMVSHPAYAYYVRDYNLTQIPIEFEGRDPTPKQLTRVLQRARAANIKTIFTQPQYHDKGAQLIAKQIGARIVSLNPYAEDYFPMMDEITQEFAKKDSNGSR